jgi:hypothetical protein
LEETGVGVTVEVATGKEVMTGGMLIFLLFI